MTALASRKRGRKADAGLAQTREVQQLMRENARLREWRPSSMSA